MAEKNPCLLQLQSFLRWINVIFMQLYLSLYLPSQCTFEKFERRDWFLHPLLLILLPHLRRSLTAIPHSWKSSLLEAQIQGEGEGARPLKSKNLQVVMCKLYVITMEIKVSFLEVNLQIFHLILRFSPQILTAIALLSGIPFSPWRSAPPPPELDSGSAPILSSQRVEEESCYAVSYYHLPKKKLLVKCARLEFTEFTTAMSSGAPSSCST